MARRLAQNLGSADTLSNEKKAARRCTQNNIVTNAALGLEYDDTLVLLGGKDTPANKLAWTRGSIQFKLILLEAQRKLIQTNGPLLIHLGKHYLGQEAGDDGGGDFDIKVTLDGDTA